MMSRQASTEPNIRSKSRRIVSCSRLAARLVARFTASDVQPTPPAAPVTVMICGPRTAESWRIVAAAEQPGDDLEQLARLGRQGQELACPGADGLEDQRAVARGAGGQEDGVRASGWCRLAISSTAWFGSESRAIRQRSGTISAILPATAW